ncbi:MAG: CAP domain-containing protein [Candidatus Kerfeldbacteria bacterium]|nr:CAP domain-containing protein [Candidatus Kerfeldbacteria bacterium]
MRWLLIVLGLLATVPAGAATTSTDIVDTINLARSGEGQPALTEDTGLAEVAAMRLADVTDRGSALHEPGDEEALSAAASAAGVDAAFLGENISSGLVDANAIVNAWLGSTSHRRNVLDAAFSRMGVATAFARLDGRPTFVVVAVFAGAAPGSTPAPERSPSTTVRALLAGASTVMVLIIVVVIVRR